MIHPLPKVYPITDVRLSGLSHTEQLAALKEGGATLIQLREKQLAPSDFFQQALEAVALARSWGVRVIINDRADVALAVKADGVHVGQDDLPPEAVRKLLGNDAIVGYSTHNIEQVHYALSLPLDYLAIGPVFATKSKSDTEPVVGLEGVRLASRVAGNLPIVAIGGITHENASEVIKAGASSVAVISALLNEPNLITSRTQRLFEAVNRS
jgi:thiamine-phosphate pyrophosphorylase